MTALVAAFAATGYDVLISSSSVCLLVKNYLSG
jgi:hypothetical protein